MAEKYQENATSEVSFDINSSTGEKDPCMDTLCTLIIYCIIVLFKFVSKTKKKKKRVSKNGNQGSYGCPEKKTEDANLFYTHRSCLPRQLTGSRCWHITVSAGPLIHSDAGHSPAVCQPYQ